jgi:predicted dehydrogenase
MSKEKLGVLVNGAGWVSTEHIKAFQRNPNTRVVAIASRRLSSAKTKADEMGLKDVRIYDDLGKALEQPDVDIVSVCTPQHIHAENVIMAARAKKHIVIEKPIANSLQEVKRMRAAIRKVGVKTVVSFVLRWNPLFETIKAMMADNALGDIYHVTAEYQHDIASWWSGWSWARRKDAGVSAFLVGGCHAIDAMRWFASKERYRAAEPEEVFTYNGGHRKGKDKEYDYYAGAWRTGTGALEYDDLEVALVKFKNGVVGEVAVDFGCIMPYNFPIQIFGTKGTIKDNRVWSHKYPGQRDWVTIPTILPDTAEVSHHPFEGEINHFVGCVLQDKESHCNLEDAIKTHEIAFAALQCYKKGVPIKLPLLR